MRPRRRRAPGRVDQHRRRLHAGQFRRADQMARRLGQRNVQADDVRSLQQLVEGRDEARTGRCRCAWCGGPPCRSPAPAGPRPGRCARIRRARASPRARRGPGASRTPSPSIALPGGPAPHRDARRVAVRIRRKARSAVVSSSTPGVLQTVMPIAGCRDDVDVVVAHGRIGHDPEPPRPPGLQDGRIDAIGQMADDAVALGGQTG